MHRRKFLQLMASAGAAVSIPGIPGARAAPDISNLVDVHCHIFNARDLPIEGFIQNIIVERSADFKKLPRSIQKALLFYVRELSAWSNDNAFDWDAEKNELERLAAGGSPLADFSEREKQHCINVVGRFIDIALEPRSDQLRRRSLRGLGGYVPIAIVGLIHQAAFPHRYYAPVQGINIKPPEDPGAENFHALPHQQWEKPGNLGPALYASKDVVGHYVRWIMQFTRFRHELGSTLARIHDGKAALATPALIDYTHWLDDRNKVSLDQQVRTMGLISRHFGKQSTGVRIHGFAPYDPLRQVLFEQGKEAVSSFERVKTAVNSEGFIGVKLYPPMGFRALDNSSIVDDRFFPRVRRKELGISKIGPGLDGALRQLYQWCAANQVPILAHAAHSNGPSSEAEDRAGPEFWKLVLDEFPDLRLCLAHFGDFEQGLVPGSKLSDTWEWKIAALMNAKPNNNLYADISYLHSSLIVPGVKDGPRKEAQRMFGTTVARYGDVLKRKLVFGSDWSMLGIEDKFSLVGGSYNRIASEFLTGITIPDPADPKKRIKAFSEPNITDIFRTNAIRYLGLGTDQRPNGTRGRLEKFYSDNNLSSGWLNAHA